MTSCAATTTIREALGRLLAQDSWEKPHVDAGLAAAASLEQLVEAAQRIVISDGTRAEAFRAALAAVGPGQETT